jgi:Aldehyde dehydrogenase family
VTVLSIPDEGETKVKAWAMLLCAGRCMLQRGGCFAHRTAWTDAQVVEAATGIGNLLLGTTLRNVASGIDCYSHRQPLGVVSGVCPFNFPAMVWSPSDDSSVTISKVSIVQ